MRFLVSVDEGLTVLVATTATLASRGTGVTAPSTEIDTEAAPPTTSMIMSSEIVEEGRDGGIGDVEGVPVRADLYIVESQAFFGFTGSVTEEEEASFFMGLLEVDIKISSSFPATAVVGDDRTRFGGGVLFTTATTALALSFVGGGVVVALLREPELTVEASPERRLA